MTRPSNPVDILNHSNLSAKQIFVVAMTVFLNALDGFDLLSISFAAPGIANEWGVDRAALGIVLSMELVGMGVGAVLLGGMADKFGRRFSVLACLGMMLFGMIGATLAVGIVDLSLYRIITGLGLGGMLAVNNALVAEFSNNRRRKLCISLMVIGFSVGGVVGGYIASQLLAHFEWRSVFYFGAAITAAAVPIVYFFVPESIPWLARSKSPGALARINSILANMGHSQATELPRYTAAESRGSVKDIFLPGQIRGTLMITAMYLVFAITFYFMLKWGPKIVVDMGFHPSAAGTVLVWANVGGVIGGIVFGLMTLRINLRLLMFTALLMSSLSVIAFGYIANSLATLSFFSAFNGFFSVAALSGTYALMAQIYPTHARGFGTGFTMSIGRGGAILSPILAGMLFASGLDLLWVCVVMSSGALLALLFMMLTPFNAAPASASI